MKKRFTSLCLVLAGLCVSCTPPVDSPATRTETEPREVKKSQSIDFTIHGINIADLSVDQALQTYKKILIAVPGTAASLQEISHLDFSDPTLVVFLGQDGAGDAASSLSAKGRPLDLGWITAVPPEWDSIRTLPHLIER